MSASTTVVFPTCLVELVRPPIAAAAAELVRQAGSTPVAAKGATCCGQPAWNSGFAPEARRVARRTLRALDKTEGPIVIPSGSCTAMIHEYWPVLFAGTDDEAAAKRVAGRVRELSEHLADQLDPANAGNRETVAFHDSCHMLRMLRLKDEPRRVLGAARFDVEEVEGGERCCGFGGTFSMKLPEISTAMADEKLDEFAAGGASTVVGCDLSCLVHLEGRARRRGMPIAFRHLAELVAEKSRG